MGIEKNLILQYIYTMKKAFVTGLLIISFSFSLFGESSFENNFLQSYLNFENAFLQISGDYGTTFFPFLNMTYGGRDAAFSGAFTAVADDISALEKNPAATASLRYTELFFSHNKIMGDVNYNAIAYSMRLNDLGFGAGVRVLYLPFTHYDKFGVDIGNGVISYSVITLNASYNLLRTYDFFGLSIGGNVKLYVYNVPDTIAEEQSRTNVVFDLGLLSRFNFLKAYYLPEKNFSLGFAVKNLGPFTDGEPPPTTLTFGFSYKPVAKVLITSDVNMLINYSDMTYKNWSVNGGLEVQFTKFSSLIAGMTIKSNPSFALGVNFDFEDFSITALYNPDFVDLFRFSVSASLKLGDLGRGKKEELIKKMFARALRLINDGNHKAAREVLLKILEKDPGYSPAKKRLEYSKKLIELEDNFERLSEEQSVLEGK